MPATDTTTTATVETPFGAVHVTGVSAKRIVVQAGNVISGQYEFPPLKINGVEIGMRYSLEIGKGTRITIGQSFWEVEYATARPRPLDWETMNKSVSWSAQTKIREVVLVKVVEWIAAHPEFLQAAQEDRNAQERKSIERKIAEREQEIAELRQALAAL